MVDLVIEVTVVLLFTVSKGEEPNAPKRCGEQMLRRAVVSKDEEPIYSGGNNFVDC